MGTSIKNHYLVSITVRELSCNSGVSHFYNFLFQAKITNTHKKFSLVATSLPTISVQSIAGHQMKTVCLSNTSMEMDTCLTNRDGTTKEVRCASMLQNYGTLIGGAITTNLSCQQEMLSPKL